MRQSSAVGAPCGNIPGNDISRQGATNTDTLRIVGITKRVSFDVRTAFEPVVPLAGQPYILIVSPALPVKNVKDLIAYSMNQPLSYGSSGVGTVAHIGLEFLTEKTGAKFVHVPYKGGGQTLLALLGGEIHMYPGLLLSAGAAIKTGTPRAIINAINRHVGEFMNSPQMAQKLLAEGSQAAERMTPGEFKTFFAREYEEVERQIKQIKVKIY